MNHLIEAIKALNLRKEDEEALHGLLGLTATTGHRLGFSPDEEVCLISLIVDFVTEVRDRFK